MGDRAGESDAPWKPLSLFRTYSPLVMSRPETWTVSEQSGVWWKMREGSIVPERVPPGRPAERESSSVYASRCANEREEEGRTFERRDAHRRLLALAVLDQAAAAAAAEVGHDEVDLVLGLAELLGHLVADVGVAEAVEAVLDERDGRLVGRGRDGVLAAELRDRLVEERVEAEDRVGLGEVLEALLDDEHGVVVLRARGWA